MRLAIYFVLAIVLTAGTGCEKKDTSVQQPISDTEVPQSDAMEPAEDIAYPGGPLVRHMHMHAAQLERLNAALDAGDMVAAGTPAYWLSRHEMLPNMPETWRPHMAKMRMAAEAVEAAADIEAARAAASRIEDSCRGCHEAAGAGPT
ncbi:MAG: hypothetical protein KJO54_10350 [Gammaproteobacteria bacterium]|nr:hypothetical protein [Gammaproteobacteria bacterium]NNF61500.1 hypothetical protein [Gammaproteobacteria bacterium]